MGWGGEKDRETSRCSEELGLNWSPFLFWHGSNKLVAEKSPSHVDRCYNKPVLSNIIRYSKPTPVFLYFIFWPPSSIPESLIYFAFLNLSKWPWLSFQRKNRSQEARIHSNLCTYPYRVFLLKKKNCIFTTFITVWECSSFHLRLVPTPVY